jgi:hypothetical protein
MYVSFDIKQGNFNAIKQYCPNLFPGTWEEFLSKFTDSEFTKKTKNRRSYIFVAAGLHKLCVRICEREIDLLEKFLLESDLELVETAFKGNDELIFELDSLDPHVIGNIEDAFCDYAKNDIFKVEFFTLKEIPGHPWFFKESTRGRRSIKCVQDRDTIKAIDIINSL